MTNRSGSRMPTVAIDIPVDCEVAPSPPPTVLSTFQPLVAPANLAQFRTSRSINKKNLSSSLCFELIASTSFSRVVSDNANKYRTSRKENDADPRPGREWHDCNEKEQRVFIGILLCMGLAKMHHIRDHGLQLLTCRSAI